MPDVYHGPEGPGLHRRKTWINDPLRVWRASTCWDHRVPAQR